MVRDLPVLYDLIALAIQTDSTRVATLEVGGSFVTADLGIPRATTTCRTTASARKRSSCSSRSSATRWSSSPAFWRSSGRSASRPATVRSSTTRWSCSGSGMGNANSHINTDLPIILAGGGFRHGEHKSYPQEQSAAFPSVICTRRCSSVGVETDRFGTGTGTLTGLELA